jgi:hypothetical protein
MDGLLWDLAGKFRHGGPRVNGDCAVRPVHDAVRECGQSMIPKSGYRFSEKIMLQQ